MTSGGLVFSFSVLSLRPSYKERNGGSLLSGMEVTAFPQRTEWAVVRAVAVVAREAGSFVSHGECPLGSIQGFLGKDLC